MRLPMSAAAAVFVAIPAVTGQQSDSAQKDIVFAPQNAIPVRRHLNMIVRADAAEIDERPERFDPAEMW